MTQELEDQVIVGAVPALGAIRFEQSPRRVRAFFNRVAVADSRRVMIMLEPRHLPVYYLPIEDIRMDLLVPSDHETQSATKGIARYWTVRVGERETEDAAWRYPEPPPGAPDIGGHVAFYWAKMDAWFEEDDEVFVHPRDPYHRVDVLNSSRHVRVVAGGQTIAETRRPRLLFETNLPTRYYVPKADVRMDLLEPSATLSACPYKGRAIYWSVRVGDFFGEDFAWSYPFPIPECPKIENLICFFDERVDETYVDGQPQPKPVTPWGR